MLLFEADFFVVQGGFLNPNAEQLRLERDDPQQFVRPEQQQLAVGAELLEQQ